MPVKRSFNRSNWKKKKPDYHNKHRVEFPEVVREIITKSEIILEVLDARSIKLTRNLELEKFIKSEGKKIIRVINKVDLINLTDLKKKVELASLEPYVFYSAKEKTGKARLQEKIKIEAKKAKTPFPNVRVGIVGYPNTGKSSLINSLVGAKKVSTSKESGHTKAIQMIKFSKNIMLLDTPGVIPESENPQLESAVLKKHAKANIRHQDKVKNPDLIVMEIMEENPGKLQDHYNIKTDDVEELIEKLAIKRNFLKKGGKPDTQRAARLILREVQEGKINVENN